MGKFFNFTDYRVYEDFKEGVIAYRKHIIKPFEDNYDKMVDSIRNSLSSLNLYSGLEEYILNSQITSMKTMAKNLGVSQTVENSKYFEDISSPGNVLNISISQAFDAADAVRKMIGNIEKFNIPPISQVLYDTDSFNQTVIDLNQLFNNSAVFQTSKI